MTITLCCLFSQLTCDRPKISPKIYRLQSHDAIALPCLQWLPDGSILLQELGEAEPKESHHVGSERPGPYLVPGSILPNTFRAGFLGNTAALQQDTVWGAEAAFRGMLPTGGCVATVTLLGTATLTVVIHQRRWARHRCRQRRRSLSGSQRKTEAQLTQDGGSLDRLARSGMTSSPMSFSPSSSGIEPSAGTQLPE